MQPKVKICGITNVEDAVLAQEYGADYLGVLVDVPISPRSQTVAQAKEIMKSVSLPTVILVYKKQFHELKAIIEQLQPFGVQFVVEENLELISALKVVFANLRLWQALHIPAEESVDSKSFVLKAEEYLKTGIDTIVLDTAVKNESGTHYGGTGKTSNWELAQKLVQEIKAPVFLAGGLNPDNVVQAIQTVKPTGVDVSSGLETVKGKKDANKVQNFIVKAKECM